MSIVQKSDHRYLVLVTVGIGTFLSSLNTSITNTILPVIQHAFHLTMGQSEWIVLIYLLVLTLFLLPVGRLSDLVGHRTLFLFGFVLFTLSALFSGIAQSDLWLLIGRAMLALAGSMILAVGPALLTTSFAPSERGKVLGMQAIMTYIGLSLGPALGGWLAQSYGWQSTFLVTIPFGIAGLLLGLLSVPKIVVEHKKTFDRLGFVFFLIAMSSITLLLNSNAMPLRKAVNT